MEIVEQTPQGFRTRVLSKEEIQALALEGNQSAKKEVCKEKLSKAVSLQEELDAIKELLGL